MLCYILRCGWVRFSHVVNPTVRFGYVLYPTVRFGGVFQCHETYVAVRCGFEQGKNRTVRFGAVIRTEPRTEPHRTDKKTRTVKKPGKNNPDPGGDISQAPVYVRLRPTAIYFVYYYEKRCRETAISPLDRQCQSNALTDSLDIKEQGTRPKNPRFLKKA